MLVRKYKLPPTTDSTVSYTHITLEYMYFIWRRYLARNSRHATASFCNGYVILLLCESYFVGDNIEYAISWPLWKDHNKLKLNVGTRAAKNIHLTFTLLLDTCIGTTRAQHMIQWIIGFSACSNTYVLLFYFLCSFEWTQHISIQPTWIIFHNWFVLLCVVLNLTNPTINSFPSKLCVI